MTSVAILGIPKRKERHRESLSQRVLKVAEELFAQDGYRNVSMRKIAEKIEYSPTTIYCGVRDWAAGAQLAKPGPGCSPCLRVQCAAAVPDALPRS
jgi:hypothetical protein